MPFFLGNKERKILNAYKFVINFMNLQTVSASIFLCSNEEGEPVLADLVNHPIDIRKVLDEEYSKFNFLDK